VACDQPSAPACAAHYHCDPAAAKSASTKPIEGATETDDPTRAAARGCIRTRCDESGGFPCLSDWECAPERALEDTGCAAIPCTELGHCQDDDYYICEPTSSAPRPNLKDSFGCVPRNCEEGFDCTYNENGENFAYCDAGAPEADPYGCRIHDCTEMPSACAAGSFRCEPGDPTADRLGCVPAGAGGSGGTGGSGGAGGSTGGSGGSTLGGGSGTAGVAGALTGGTAGKGGAGGTAGSGGSSATGGSSAVGGAAGTTSPGGSAGTTGDVTGVCAAE
jgi:hypothetical protein